MLASSHLPSGRALSRASAYPTGPHLLRRPGYPQRLGRIDRRLGLRGKDTDVAVDAVEMDLPFAKERHVFGHDVGGDVNRTRAADSEIDGLEEGHQVLIRPGGLQGIDDAGTPQGKIEGPADRGFGSHAGDSQRHSDGWE